MIHLVPCAAIPPRGAGAANFVADYSHGGGIGLAKGAATIMHRALLRTAALASALLATLAAAACASNTGSSSPTGTNRGSDHDAALGDPSSSQNDQPQPTVDSGSNNPPPSAQGDAAGGGNADGGANGEGGDPTADGGTDSGPTGDSGDDAGAGQPVGWVYFETDGTNSAVVADFVGAGDTSLASCSFAAAGSCVLTTCPLGTGYDAGALPSAGNLTLYGGALGSSGLVLYPGGGSDEYSYQTGGTLFTSTDTLSVVASGADVPSFAQSVPGVDYVTVDSPQAFNGTVYLTTSQDLDVQWSGGVTGSFVSFEFATETGGQKIGATCTFDAAAGQGTVPSTMLGPLAGTNGLIVAGQFNTAPVTSGSFNVNVATFAYGYANASFQ